MLGLSPGISAYILFITALLGLVSGSFINCIAWRTANHGSALRGRSQCVVCAHALSARDLVPLFSWIFLKGKCRYCGEKISFRYPLAELITAVLFLSAVWRFDVSLMALMGVILAVILMGIALTDIENGMIYDRFIIAGIINFIVFNFILADRVWHGLLIGLLGGVCVAVPLLIIVLIADRVLGRESMGGGDLKLIFMLGLYLGWQRSLMTLILACIIGLIFALVLNKKGHNAAAVNGPGAFPFGPSICISGWLVLLFGQKLLDFYISLFI